MKKTCFSVIIYTLILFSILSCTSITGHGIKNGLSVNEIVPGITRIDGIEDGGKYVQFLHPESGEPINQYLLDNFIVGYEEDIITSVIIQKDHDLPVGWLKLGLDWDMDFYDWMDRFQKLGFLIQVFNYPVYTMDDKYINLKGYFSAFHPEYPQYRYELSFENSGNTRSGVLEAKFNFIEINLRDESTQFYERLAYPQIERSNMSAAKCEAIAFSSLLGELNNSYHEKLEPFGFGDASGKRKALDVLADSWNIESTDDLLAMLDDLKGGGHSGSMLKLLDIIESNNDMSLLDYGVSNGFDAYKIRRLIFIQNYKDLSGLRERSLRAWDCGRSISLSRWGYNAGYISKEEAWEIIFEYRKLILKLYNSWEDYASNYALGRMFWASGSSRIQTKEEEILSVFEKLSHRDGSVWNGSWDNENLVTLHNNFNTRMNDILYITTPEEISLKNYYEGIKFYKAGLYEDAEKEFKKAVNRFPNFLYPNIYLGFCERNLGDLNKAVFYFKKYYESNIFNYFGAIYYGEALEDFKKLDDAVFVLKSVLSIKPNYPQVYKSLARIYLKQKEFELALYILLEYDKFVLEDSKAYYADFLKGSLAYETKDYSRGVKYLQRCYESYSKDGYINYILGICYLYQNNVKYDIAYRYLSRAKEYGHRIPDNIKKFIQDWENKNKIIPGTDPLV